MDHPYPFTAIVGQEQMKLALVLNLINPALGGVLIQGEKGTAKSTAVRGLTGLLDEVQVVEGCPFHCRPGQGELCGQCREKARAGRLKTVPYTRRVVELPVSATEDRVVGSLSMEQAIQKGEKVLNPAFWPRPTAISSMWTRSICWTTTSWTYCWTAPPWASTPWSGRESATAIPPALYWWAP